MKINGVQVLNLKSHHDTRGSFLNVWRAQVNTSEEGLDSLCQVNISYNVKAGTTRGLHCQISPFQEQKLVICLSGAILDVLVDVRPFSPTFGNSMLIELQEEIEQAIFVPKMVLHGFQTLVDETSVLYLHSGLYDKSSERGVHPLDETLKIPWKMTPTVISDRDLRLPRFHEFIDHL